MQRHTIQYADDIEKTSDEIISLCNKRLYMIVWENRNKLVVSTVFVYSHIPF